MLLDGPTSSSKSQGSTTRSSFASMIEQPESGDFGTHGAGLAGGEIDLVVGLEFPVGPAAHVPRNPRAMTSRGHRQRLASLEPIAPLAPVPGLPTVGDILDAVADSDKRQRLAAAVAELIALDARRDTLTDAGRGCAPEIARVVRKDLPARQ